MCFDVIIMMTLWNSITKLDSIPGLHQRRVLKFRTCRLLALLTECEEKNCVLRKSHSNCSISFVPKLLFHIFAVEIKPVLEVGHERLTISTLSWQTGLSLKKDEISIYKYYQNAYSERNRIMSMRYSYWHNTNAFWHFGCETTVACPTHRTQNLFMDKPPTWKNH